MAKRSAPDPEINIVAVRAAARRAALLFAKGIGERVVLREAAAIFDVLCPKLPRGLARLGRKLVITHPPCARVGWLIRSWHAAGRA